MFQERNLQVIREEHNRKWKMWTLFLIKSIFPIYQFDSFYIIRREHIKNQHNTTIILLCFCYFFYFFLTNLHIDINICNFIHVLFFSFLFILLKLLI